MSQAPPSLPPRRPAAGDDFPLGPVLMVVVVAAVLIAIVVFFVVGQLQTDRSRQLNNQFAFILLTLAGPLTVMIVVSTVYSAFSWFSGKRE